MLPKPLLLDAYCCAGGAGYGYFLAGFEVVGVDQEKQPNNPFECYQGDAVEFIRQHGHEFDFIHASPPCQFGTQLQHLHKHKPEYHEVHINLIPDTRAALLDIGKPYVIENVPGARKHLIKPVMLCGKTLGLKVYRHRYFECSFDVTELAHLKHNDHTPRAGGGVSPKGFVTVAGHGGVKYIPDDFDGGFREYAGMAMDISWMSRAELSQAIPPTYTQYIGAEWLKQNGYAYTYPETYAPKQLALFA